jgi:chemotaxis protein MotB
MMTLLCGFFIMLYTMTNLDQKKYQAVAAEIAKQFGGKVESPLEILLKDLKTKIDHQKLVLPFEITMDTYGILIVFQSTLFFETLSAEVLPDGQEALKRVAQVIRDTQKDKKRVFRIVVEGHSDARNVVSGLFASNWELSAARAARVVRTFLDEHFDPKQMTAVGYADTHPVAPDKNKDGSWNEANLAKNRRVVIRILDPAFHGMVGSENASPSHGKPPETPTAIEKPSVPPPVGLAPVGPAAVGGKPVGSSAELQKPNSVLPSVGQSANSKSPLGPPAMGIEKALELNVKPLTGEKK